MTLTLACSSVFVRRRSVAAGDKRDELVVIGCYVDDLFIVYSHDDEQSIYSEFTSKLTETWKAEDEGEVTDLLNVEISSTDGAVELRQSGYISTMAANFLQPRRPAA